MAGKRIAADSGNPVEPDNGPVVDSGTSAGTESEPIDPASLAGNDDGFERDSDGNLVLGASGKPRRKRGRKPGSGSGGTIAGSAKPSARNTKDLAAGLETLSQSLMFVHMGLAAFTDFENWKLKKEESDSLANSIANVMNEFDMTPDPRFAAVAGLITTAGMIYGPRVYLYREFKAEKRKQKRAENPAANSAPANTQQFNPGDFSGYNLGG